MGWNSPSTKSISGLQRKQIGYGAPVSINPGTAGRPYMDGWDVRRAYEEGMRRVVWVYRAIDVIASNQAKLPIVLRKNNDPNGEIVKGEHQLLTILNSRANIGESAFVFRYRITAQLMLSTRGVFIEKIRGRGGQIIALNILPPEFTAPIPDPKTFVSGYEVWIPGGNRVVLKPDDVLWIRNPHPLDPYRSLTPMESAGMAIDIENLAKAYNRNFLINDGRPGLLLIANGEVDEDDRHELEARFRGGPTRAGNTTVLGIEGGMTAIDMAANMRDASYVQMRELTKDEILAAFGVPETLLASVGDKTFANASEEVRVFWLERMDPHLELLTQEFDLLEPKYYVSFFTDEVPIKVLIKQEKYRFQLEEFKAGVISANEYRLATERKEAPADLADSLLQNPNLAPIANTKKKMELPAAEAPGAPPGAPGAPLGAPGAPPAELPPGQEIPAETPAEPQPAIEAALAEGSVETKIGKTQGTIAAVLGEADWLDRLDDELKNPNSEFVSVKPSTSAEIISSKSRIEA